jgi:tRNA(fMet)-specific endonuclease VapC
MKYMLDTNICIHLVKKKSPLVLERLKKNRSQGIAISAITQAELWHGVENSVAKERNTIALLELLSILTVLPFEEAAAEEYGKVKSSLQRQGLLIGPLDTLIAAHAKSLNMVLVTNNTREFIRVAGLAIEDWVK